MIRLDKAQNSMLNALRMRNFDGRKTGYDINSLFLCIIYISKSQVYEWCDHLRLVISIVITEGLDRPLIYFRIEFTHICINPEYWLCGRGLFELLNGKSGAVSREINKASASGCQNPSGLFMSQ